MPEKLYHTVGSRKIRCLLTSSFYDGTVIYRLTDGSTSVFQQQLNSSSQSQLPPQRRITQDEAPSMMPAQATQAQHLPAQFTQQQHLQSQTHGSVASFASLSAGAGGHTRKKPRLG
jgi:hypothetical protein